MKTSFGSAIVIAILLLVAAIAKALYPMSLPFCLNPIAIVLEICIAVLLLCNHRKPWIWKVLSAVFSLWLGYSLFWFIRHENCGCFGYALDASAGISVAINAIVIGMSFWNWNQIEKGAKEKIFFIVVDVLLLIAGYLFALTVNWMTGGEEKVVLQTEGAEEHQVCHVVH